MCWCFVVLIEGLVCAGVLWYLLRDLCVLVFVVLIEGLVCAGVCGTY